MMKIKQHLKIISVSILLSACAKPSILSSEQTVNIAVVNRETLTLIPTAKCQVYDDRGNITDIKTNPGSITIGNDRESLTVKCNAKNYTQKVLGVAQNINDWTLDNIHFLPNFNAMTGKGTLPSNVIVFMTTAPDPSTQKTDHAFNQATENDPFFQGRQAT